MGKLGIGEDPLDDGSSGKSDIVGEGGRDDADAYDKRTERLGLPSVGVGARANGRPLYDYLGVECLADARTDLKPDWLDGMIVNGARLTDDSLLLKFLPPRRR